MSTLERTAKKFFSQQLFLEYTNIMRELEKSEIFREWHKRKGECPHIFTLPLLHTPVQSKDKPYQAPINPLVHITHQPTQQQHSCFAMMPDYMTLHASAYPPASWAFLANRPSKPSRTSNNELWTEMTNRYEQSMAKRYHEFTSNCLSETATADNINRMRADAKKRHGQQGAIAFEDAADIEDLLEKADRFIEAVDELAKNSMKSIPEEDESGATYSRRRPTVNESRQIKKAILNSKNYDQLLQSIDKIKKSFRPRLMDIYTTCHDFICTPVGKHPRPRWAQICRIDKEVTAHVAHVAHIQQQVTSDVAQLEDFLREQLYDQYCLMRETPMEKKDETWLQYGDCFILGPKNGEDERSLTKETAENFDLGDRGVERRLDRMIDGTGLDPTWIMDRIEDYCRGNDHIGRWQRYVQGCQWEELAAKLSDDIDQLEKINSSSKSSSSRQCNIMSNIHNTKRQFFKRLDGAQDFELSERALRMDEGYESTSASSSTTSLVMDSWDYSRDLAESLEAMSGRTL